MRSGRLLFAMLLALALLAVPAATAGAAVTVGQTAPVSEEASCSGFFVNEDYVQTPTATGPSYVVPAPGGVITSWSTMAALDKGEPQYLALAVLRPGGGSSYSGVATDRHLLTPGVLNTFPVQIPVRGGDLIALELENFFGESGEVECGFETKSKTDALGYIEPALGIGEVGEVLPDDDEYRLNVSANLVPPPTVAAINPPSGSVTGTPVTIAGANFNRVSGVSFGGVPAAFSVGSEGQISATAPHATALGEVPVTVTTFAGTTAVPSTFTYEGCSVPKLKGKKLKAAKSGAAAADCKLGKVKKKKGATARTGKVVGQTPKPGSLVAPGTAVKVTLGG
jgi:hypothetical protein